MAATLSRNRFEAARAFLFSHARPLEQALFGHAFEGAAGDDALTALAAFQNPDGGFGHGLEADIRLPASSVICTSIAFQVLRGLGTSAEHPLVAQACKYLVNTFDADTLNWPDVPAAIDEAPHAPWWVHRDDLAKRRFNPRAELAGYLLDYSRHFTDPMRREVVDSVVASIAGHKDEMEMHDLLCVLRFWQSRGLAVSDYQSLAPKVHELVSATVSRDPAGWRTYGLTPLDVAPMPSSPFAAEFGDLLDTQLDEIIARQSPSGGWEPHWTWGADEVAWLQAKADWSGVLTLGNLQKLDAFGRLSL